MVRPTNPARKPAFGSLEVHGQDASPLFGLPGELRNRYIELYFIMQRGLTLRRIYRLVLLEQDAIQVVDAGYARPGLLTTCQQIANESTAMYYEENKFDVRAWDYNPHSLYNFVRGINALAERGHSMKPKMRLAIKPSSTNWKNVVKWMKHVFDGNIRGGIFPGGDLDRIIPQMPGITELITVRAMLSTVKAFKGKASRSTVEEVLKAHR